MNMWYQQHNSITGHMSFKSREGNKKKYTYVKIAFKVLSYYHLVFLLTQLVSLRFYSKEDEKQ